MTQSNFSPFPETIPKAFTETCREAAARIAMQMKVGMQYHRFTYSELHHQVQALTSAFIQQGIQLGNRVAIVSENRPEWVISYLSILAAGGTAVPLDIQMSEKDITSLIEQSGSHLVVASDQTMDLVKNLPSQTHLITLDHRTTARTDPYEELIAQGMKKGMSPTRVQPEDEASLLYTSGTTGSPKGVVLTHRNLVSNALAMRSSGLADSQDNFLLMLPLHHSYPFMISCLVPLLLGARITILQSLKGPDLLQCLQETQITMVVGVPQVFAMVRRAVLDQINRRPLLIRMVVTILLVVSGLIRRKTRWNPGRFFFKTIHQRFGGSLRLLCSGGAKLDFEVARDFERLGFTMLQGYGLTETSPVVTFTPLGKPKLPSVGMPIQGVTVQIAHPDAGGIGEVVVRGPNVMKGYDGNPEATNKAIRDGWYYTGDLGYLDDEGYLYLTGRSKELIVTAGGKNIYPEELEREYQTSPAIAEICVMSADLIEKGRIGIHAIILPNVEYLKSQQLLDAPQLLKDELTRIGLTLPPYKRITGLSLIKEPLPRTRLGKIKRHEVPSLLKAGTAPEEEDHRSSEMNQAILADETARKVIATLTKHLPKSKSIRLDDHLDLDLGLDSLQRVELTASLEQQFGPLPDTLATAVITVKDLIDKINETVKKPTEGQAPRFQSWHDLINSLPPQDLTTRLGQIPGFVQRLMETLSRRSLWFVCRLAFRLELKGLDHLPQEGPFILALNHVSHVDPLVVLISVPKTVFNQLYTLGWEPYFRGGIGKFMARLGHVIPVGADTSLVTVLQTSATVLKQSKSLLIFPEGERSLDGRLLEFRKGVGILACEIPVPVVPAWIDGTYEVLPVGSRWPRPHPVSLRFGKPFLITACQIEEWKKEGRDPYEFAANFIQEQVIQLVPKPQAEEKAS